MSDLDGQAQVPNFDTAAHRANPHPAYHRLRSTQPIAPSPDDENGYILTRFADCEAVLRDHRWSVDPTKRPLPPEHAIDVRTDISFAGANVLLFIDPPDHTRLRRLVSKAFTPRTVEKLRPRVQRLVDEILDLAEERGELDIVGDLGFVLPVTVICEMIGVPVEDQARFGPWSTDATRLLDGVLDAETTMRGMVASASIIDYLNGLIEDHRAHPRDDLLSALIAAEEEGDRLTEEELRINAMLLFVAGHETTMNLIGNGMYALLQNRDQFDRLREDPSLAPSAIEELLRYDGPAHLTGRIATQDLVVGGHEFHAGDQVMTLLAAGNRDPDRFTDPDRLDIGRQEGPHLAFAHGLHYCLGAALARMEGQVAISSLVQRFPKMEILTEDVRYRDHVVLRGLTELRVAVNG